MMIFPTDQKKYEEWTGNKFVDPNGIQRNGIMTLSQPRRVGKLAISIGHPTPQLPPYSFFNSQAAQKTFTSRSERSGSRATRKLLKYPNSTQKFAIYSNKPKGRQNGESFKKWMERSEQKVRHSNPKFEILRERIRSFEHLSTGWDSYDAEPITKNAVHAALALVALLEKTNILPEWVVPTSDASVLMQISHEQCVYKWQFESDGDIAVMVKRLFEQPEYIDLEPHSLQHFLAERIHAPI